MLKNQRGIPGCNALMKGSLGLKGCSPDGRKWPITFGVIAHRGDGLSSALDSVNIKQLRGFYAVQERRSLVGQC